MSVFRFDIGSLKSPERMPNGWLRVDGYLTRTGVFTYRNPDGTERRELRLQDEVFRGDSLKTFSLVPVTDDHPPELLDASNTKKYAVGAVADNARRDGEFVRASMLVTDAQTIAKMDAGKVQLSCGYTCDLEFAPGEFEGQRYDAIQRNIRGNHVALVEVGRAGTAVKVRMDNADAVMVASHLDTFSTTSPEEQTVKVKINGIEFDIADAAAQALELERKDAADKFNAATKSVATAQAELDATKAELTKVEAARKDAADPSKFHTAVAARVALEVVARKHLGAEAKLDSMDDAQVKVAVLGKLMPETKLDGKSSDYVQALFDIATTKAEASNTGLAAARTAAVTATESKTDKADDDTARRQKMIEENRNRWKQPITVGMTAEK